MNSGKAAYIVGFVIWIFSGFKLTFREAIGYDHKESLYFKYHPYKVTEHLSSGKFKFGKSRTISGEYNNAAKKEVHLDKRNQHGYDFKDVAEMEAYSKDFFAREGNNIIELEQNGYIHRIDTKTQGYGVINPNGKVETVFKVTPNENSKFKNAQEYLNNQVKQ